MNVRIPSLPRPNIAQALSGLNPVALIALANSLSHAVNTGVSGTCALAAALQAAGAQRLGSLHVRAPNVRAALDKLASHLPNVRLNVEEIAIVCAVIQFYLGLILQLLAAEKRSRHNLYLPGRLQRPVTPHFWFIHTPRSHRTCIGVLLPSTLLIR